MEQKDKFVKFDPDNLLRSVQLFGDLYSTVLEIHGSLVNQSLKNMYQIILNTQKNNVDVKKIMLERKKYLEEIKTPEDYLNYIKKHRKNG